MTLLGDAERVEELRRGVLLVLRRQLRDPALAEDLCSEAFRIVLERLAREPLEDPQKLPAFLAQTARNLAIGELRRSGRRRTVTGEEEAIAGRADDGAHDGAAGVEDAQRAIAVKQVLAEIRAPRDRELLVRYYLRDEDKATLCAHFRLTEEHFHRVIHRARERFRNLIERRYRPSDLYCLAL